MEKLFAGLIAAAIWFTALTAQADVENYTFYSQATSMQFEFPGLRLAGEVRGKLNLKKNLPSDYPPSPSEFDIGEKQVYIILGNRIIWALMPLND